MVVPLAIAGHSLVFSYERTPCRLASYKEPRPVMYETLKSNEETNSRIYSKTFYYKQT